MFSILLITIPIIALIIICVFIIISINKIDKKNTINPPNVKISIVVAARNEEINIKGLLNSLSNLNYLEKNFEVIVVDDNSTDNTIIKLEDQKDDRTNIKILELKPTGKNGKREALTLGIQQAQYQYILITDADCYPQKNWLIEYSNKFQQGFDMLFGIAPFYQNKNLISRISCFENLRSSIMSFSMAKIGIPYTASARNFGFSKDAFDKIEGYSKTKDTLSGDDDLLLREAAKNNLKIGVVTEPGSYVFSETKKTFTEYFRQKARHTQTSFYYLFKHKMMIGFWHLLNLCLLFSPVLMLINPVFGIGLPSKLLIDSIVVKMTQKKFSYTFSTVQVIYLQVVYEIFLIVHFFNSQFSEIKWK